MPFAHVNGIKIFYRVEGEGIPLVFLHGFRLDHRVMKLLSDGLKGSYKCILFDARGHGKSTKPLDNNSYRTMVYDIEGLLNLIGVNKAILVGYSMGGQLCLEYAASCPSKIVGLVLIATGFRYGRGGAALTTKSGKIERQIQSSFEIRSKYEAVITPAKKLISAYIVDQLMEEMNYFDFRAMASTIKNIPALIMAGEIDKYYPPYIQREMYDAFSCSWLNILEECGHGIIFEKTDECINLIQEYLNEVVG